MAEQQTAEITSHSDIGALVEGWDGFSLGESFSAESGLCTMGGVDMRGRKSLSEPHEPSRQIYRFLKGDYVEDSHRYALVTEEGEVILSARLDFRTKGSCYGQDIQRFSEKYFQLKLHLDGAEVDYTSDANFENSIIEAARLLSG